VSELVSCRHLTAPSRFAVRFIQTYRVRVGPGLRTGCRFEPSCSTYALEAYHRYGFLRATMKTLGRISRCRPGYEGPGVDPL
jgi:putative membrane protein insertion efficiency factor